MAGVKDSGDMDWETFRAQVSVNEDRVAVYRRLGRVGEQIYALLEQRGLTGDALEDAFDAVNAAGGAAELDHDIVLSSLEGYARALGGRVEVRLVLPDGTSTVLDLGPPTSGREPPA